MRATQAPIPDVLVLEPTVHEDERGWFVESWNARTFVDATGIDCTFVQDNHAHSVRHVLRGIHYQLARPQGKLIRVVAGEIFDVAVDLRRSSPTFGRWTGTTLSAGNRRQAWIPPGFGHGYLVVGESADVLYKATEHRWPEYERVLAWDDPTVAVRWPLGDRAPVLSPRDRAAPRLAEAALYP